MEFLYFDAQGRQRTVTTIEQARPEEKRLARAVLPVSSSVVYTVPAGQVLRNVYLSAVNFSASAQTVRVYESGSTDLDSVARAEIPSKGMLAGWTGWRLEAGATIRADATQATTVVLSLYGELEEASSAGAGVRDCGADGLRLYAPDGHRGVTRIDQASGPLYVQILGQKTETPKTLYHNFLPAVATLLYTAPVATSVRISYLQAANVAGPTRYFELWRNGTAAANYIIPQTNVAGGGLYYTPPDFEVMLAPGDTIYGSAQDGVSVVLYLPGTEIV